MSSSRRSKRARAYLLVAACGSAAAQSPDPNAPRQPLPPYVVTATNPAQPNWWNRRNLALPISPDLAFGRLNGTYLLITPTRAPQSPASSDVPVAVSQAPFDAESSVAGAFLDPTLLREDRVRQIPTDDEMAEPALLWDGVPAERPFDGRIPWNEYPEGALVRIEMLNPGGEAAWGSGTAFGLAQLFTSPAEGRLVARLPQATWSMLPSAQADLWFGSDATYSAAIAVSEPAVYGTLQVWGTDYFTSGALAVAPPQRGPADRPNGDRHHSGAMRWQQPLGKIAAVTATVRGFDDDASEGTDYRKLSESDRFASLRITGTSSSALAWNATAYVDHTDGTRTMSDLNATRSVETPVSDVTGEPTTAAGVDATVAVSREGGSRTVVGFDTERVEGSMTELTRFTPPAGFESLDSASGTNWETGIFGEEDAPLGDSWHGTMGLRVEACDGASQFGSAVLPLPTLGLAWSPEGPWSLSVSEDSSFVAPSLRDRLEPVYEEALLIEPNRSLKLERDQAAQATLRWRAKPQINVSATVFDRWREDPLVDAPVGPGRELRVNAADGQTLALRWNAEWQATGQLSLNADFFAQRSIITAAPTSGLDGRTFAWSPNTSARVGFTEHASKRLTVSAGVSALGREYADDANTRALARATSIDATVYYSLGSEWTLFGLIRNAGNASIQTDRSAAGIAYQGDPRAFLAGFRWTAR